ncbi:MAG: helix-turn-helix transcriptional regulator [Acidobacteria bacterium]|nr:helix-turn-helix transcriptional regulator [Acidobacteriota bacterium]
MFKPREAAQILGISFSTLKQWIYRKKLRAIRTAGGHHRIPRKEIDRYLHRAGEKPGPSRRRNFRQISGRNQLVGRAVEIKIEGLMAQVKLSIGGQQITSIITAEAAREMNLQRGDTVAALIKSTEVMLVRV